MTRRVRSLLARIRCAIGNHPPFGQRPVALHSRGSKVIIQCCLCGRKYRQKKGRK